MVEFALAAPCFLFLVFGGVELATWGFAITVTQVAARQAADAASGAYLAQYRSDTYTQVAGVADAGSAWYLAVAAGVSRGNAALQFAPHAAETTSLVWVQLTEDGLGPGQEGDRQITAHAVVFLPAFGPLPRPPGLYPYIATASVRPTRFYSY
jgi:Flp pilus assembly protein TadG